VAQRVCNAGETGQAGLRHLLLQFGHARGAARTLQLAVHVQRHAAGVIATVFEALQAFEQDGSDVCCATAPTMPHMKYLAGKVVHAY
jgi:hypothetical protein